MKQLFNEINGRSLDIAFTDDTTNTQIAKWVGENLDEIVNLGIEFNEIDSCEVLSQLNEDDTIIEITGDEDLHILKIRKLNVISINTVGKVCWE